MGVREKLEEKIRKKHLEIDEHKARIREAKVYIQAINDSLRLLPREKGTVYPLTHRMKAGSLTHKTFNLLKKTGHPMHIEEILQGIGLEFTNKPAHLSGAR